MYINSYLYFSGSTPVMQKQCSYLQACPSGYHITSEKELGQKGISKVMTVSNNTSDLCTRNFMFTFR